MSEGNGGSTFQARFSSVQQVETQRAAHNAVAELVGRLVAAQGERAAWQDAARQALDLNDKLQARVIELERENASLRRKVGPKKRRGRPANAADPGTDPGTAPAAGSRTGDGEPTAGEDGGDDDDKHDPVPGNGSPAARPLPMGE